MRGLVVVGFTWVRGVESGAPWWSLGSSGRAVGVVGARPGGRRDHSGSLGSFECHQGAVGLIQIRWVHSGGALGVVVFIWVRWDHLGAPVGRRVHSCFLGLFERAQVVAVSLGSFGCAQGGHSSSP